MENEYWAVITEDGASVHVSEEVARAEATRIEEATGTSPTVEQYNE